MRRILIPIWRGADDVVGGFVGCEDDCIDDKGAGDTSFWGGDGVRTLGLCAGVGADRCDEGLGEEAGN